MARAKEDRIKLASTVSRKEDYIQSKLGDELVMLDIDSGLYHGLSEVGAVIWDLIGQPTPVSDVCDRLLELYEVDRPTCEEQTLAFLNKLDKQEMLIVA